jgi:FkbM family methyltransferase
MLNRIRGILYRLGGGRQKSVPAPSILDAIATLCHGKANVVFDIGAYHGQYAAQAMKQIDITALHCFEPFPESFEVLKKNLEGTSCTAHPIALSDFAGVADFYVNQFNETNSLLPAVKTESQIDDLIQNKTVVQVAVRTLDGFCRAQEIEAVDVLKIDAQGNTLKILQGAKELLQKKAFGLIQCEAEFLEIYKDEALFHQIASYLEQFGYKLYSLYNLHFDVNQRLSWADALFYKNA